MCGPRLLVFDAVIGVIDRPSLLVDSSWSVRAAAVHAAGLLSASVVSAMPPVFLRMLTVLSIVLLSGDDANVLPTLCSSLLALLNFGIDAAASLQMSSASFSRLLAAIFARRSNPDAQVR